MFASLCNHPQNSLRSCTTQTQASVLQPLTATVFLSVSVNLMTLKTSGKWNHIVLVLGVWPIVSGL